MTHDDRQPFYERQRVLLIEVAELLLSRNGSDLDAISLDAWNRASSEQAKRRVIVDQVASLTDPAAIALHAKLKS
jgi:dGTPase